MTNKEAKEKLYMEWQKFLEDNIDYAGVSEAYKMAFKALEQEPCEDAVSKQAVLELVADYDLSMGQVVRGIHALPSVTQEPRWISVSEKLPEFEYGESDSVLVCFENQTQDVLYFNGSNWCYPTGEIYISVNHKNGWHNKVIAWMPLPKPYEPQESEET